MARNFENWLEGYHLYTQHLETPLHISRWCGLAVIASALRRRVWIDQYYFKWYPNMYVIIVAPPEVISKTTSIDVAMDLLRASPDIHFGPNVASWQRLVVDFHLASEETELEGEIQTLSALTIPVGELGNFLNPQDHQMIDLLVTLWDGKRIDKRTKSSGSELVEKPIVTILAATTPAWIESNVPPYMLGGDFISRCIFVFADRKREPIAYPGLRVDPSTSVIKKQLIEDLADIIKLKGEFALTRQAIEWGQIWYDNLVSGRLTRGKILRKQTHVHKLAMLLSACEGNSLVITDKHLETAVQEVEELEKGMEFVTACVGRSSESKSSDLILDEIKRCGIMPLPEVAKLARLYFPRETDISSVINGMIKAGLVTMQQEGQVIMVKWAGPGGTGA